jgi:rfaE bifunctional protein nucleotidyltransferase chain/domain
MTKTQQRIEHTLPRFAACLQFDVKAGEVEHNIATVKQALENSAPQPGTLVVLPELWAAGFHYESLADQCARSEEIHGALIKLAQKYSILFAGTLVEEKSSDNKAHYFNTLYFTGEKGVLGKYRKQQLFPPMGEDVYFSPGNSPHPVPTEYGLIGALVCFDLRFPDLAKCQASQGASVIVVSAQWPTVRRAHWQTLARARAIENQVYVVACNRFGATEGTEFGGHSMVVAPNGDVLAEAGEGEEQIAAALDPALFRRARSLFVSAGVLPYRYQDSEKICDLTALTEKLSNYKKSGRKIVFTNGCFDILHEGHATYLEAARKKGDCLVVGLNSDTSIRAIKGPGRPVNNESSRARLLASLGCVDHIVLFGEETPLNLITALLPDVLVKGADWPIDKIVGAKEVLDAGGEVVNIDMVEGFSTTGVINQIKEQD